MEVILAKYGEIALKGLNKRKFEEMLVKNVRAAIGMNCGEWKITRHQSTLFLTPSDDTAHAEIARAAQVLTKVFGIAAVQRCLKTEKNIGTIVQSAIPYLKDTLTARESFKVEAKRADKTFPMSSLDIMKHVGGELSESYPDCKVDVHNPAVTVTVEIREDGAYISGERVKGAGGLPVGSSGKALLLLSGGIDSPVAAYLCAKRGIAVECVHFESPPYTSALALDKVRRQCENLAPYCGDIKLHVVSLTEFQERLRKNAHEEYFTLLLRREMVRQSCRIARERDCKVLATGECVGQVASQTLAAMAATDAVSDLPILRPVVCLDKTEIVDIARKIGTFETSSLPYEDCCTVFTPKHPKTNPKLRQVEEEEARLTNNTFTAVTAKEIVKLLTERSKTVTTCESCTGGLIAGAITSVAGASAVFGEGYVTYANSAKEKLANVPSELLERHGAVSEQVAKAMATGARTAANSDYAVAVTGIAGPTGSTAEKPVGTVYIAVCDRKNSRVLKFLLSDMTREEVRENTVDSALLTLKDFIASGGDLNEQYKQIRDRITALQRAEKHGKRREAGSTDVF